MSDINTMTIEVHEEPTEPTYHTVFSELREIHRIVDRIEKAVGRKETSPEISALAAKYLAMDDGTLFHDILASVESYSSDDYASVYRVITDIKKLAAAARGQDETEVQE